MEIETILQLALVGTSLTAIIDYLKNKYGTTGNTTKLLTVGISVVLGSMFFLLKDTPIWQSITGILVVSQTIYAFFGK